MAVRSGGRRMNCSPWCFPTALRVSIGSGHCNARTRKERAVWIDFTLIFRANPSVCERKAWVPHPW